MTSCSCAACWVPAPPEWLHSPQEQPVWPGKLGKVNQQWEVGTPLCMNGRVSSLNWSTSGPTGGEQKRGITGLHCMDSCISLALCYVTLSDLTLWPEVCFLGQVSSKGCWLSAAVKS